MITCDCCEKPAEGEIEYMDGEILVGCADCILEIVSDPYKPVSQILEYTEEDKRDTTQK